MWWVSCPEGGCSSGTQASGAVGCGAGPSARWLCSSPSNGQTPYATTQEHNRGEAPSLEGQGQSPGAGKEDGEGASPVGHSHMDTHVRPQGWTEGKGRRRGKARHYCTVTIHYEDQAGKGVPLESSEVSGRELDFPKNESRLVL